MPSILVCTPTISGDMSFQYVLSLIKLERLCRAENIDIDYQFVAHESLIQRARNYLCDVFLHQSNHSHMLFLDSDIEFAPEDIIKMVRANVPLIGGVYPKKKIHWERIQQHPEAHMGKYLDYVVTPLTEQRVEDVTVPHEVRYIGTGMMLIERGVLHQLMKAYPKDVYMAEGRPYHLFFHSMIHDGQYLSEDYYFCEMWRRIGGKVYAAYWTQATHWGLMGYRGKCDA